LGVIHFISPFDLGISLFGLVSKAVADD